MSVASDACVGDRKSGEQGVSRGGVVFIVDCCCVCTDAGTGLGDGIASRDFLCDSPPPTLRERGANNKLQCLFQNAKYK